MLFSSWAGNQRKLLLGSHLLTFSYNPRPLVAYYIDSGREKGRVSTNWIRPSKEKTTSLIWFSFRRKWAGKYDTDWCILFSSSSACSTVSSNLSELWNRMNMKINEPWVSFHRQQRIPDIHSSLQNTREDSTYWCPEERLQRCRYGPVINFVHIYFNQLNELALNNFIFIKSGGFNQATSIIISIFYFNCPAYVSYRKPPPLPDSLADIDRQIFLLSTKCDWDGIEASVHVDHLTFIHLFLELDSSERRMISIRIISC